MGSISTLLAKPSQLKSYLDRLNLASSFVPKIKKSISKFNKDENSCIKQIAAINKKLSVLRKNISNLSSIAKVISLDEYRNIRYNILHLELMLKHEEETLVYVKNELEDLNAQLSAMNDEINLCKKETTGLGSVHGFRSKAKVIHG